MHGMPCENMHQCMFRLTECPCRDECICLPGTARTTGGTCEIGQLYPLPTLSTCPLRSYPRGVVERCTTCRMDPYPECAVGWYTGGDGTCMECVKPDNSTFVGNGKAIGVSTSCGWACVAGYYLKGNVAYARQCQPCTNMPVGVDAKFVYPVTNAQLEAPNGCTWGCRVPYKMRFGQCVACNLSNAVHPGMPCTHPLWAGLDGAGMLVDGVKYRVKWVNSTTSLTFDQNVTLDIMLVGGGGAGGGVISGVIGAGGGGGGGQIKIVYGVFVRAGTYQAYVGQGGIGGLGVYGSTAESSTFNGLSALLGGQGGLGTLDETAYGRTGASSGGSGSAGVGHVYRAANLSGWPGGADLFGKSGGGGGGAGGAGSDSSLCGGGAGGSALSVGFTGEMIAFAGGGDGGASPKCPNSWNGQDATGNTGNGGQGAIGIGPRKGWNGGAGVIVLRYVDEVCSCL